MGICRILAAFYGESYWATESLVQGPMDFFLSWVFPAVAVILGGKTSDTGEDGRVCKDR